MTKRPLDSLPYIDQVDNEYENQAWKLIEAEMGSCAKPILDKLPDVQLRTPLMKHEYERIVGKQQEPRIPISYQVTVPDSDSNLDEWKRAVQRAQLVYEAERLRSLDLEIAEQEETILSKSYNTTTQAIQNAVQSAWQSQQNAVDEINYERQTAQTQLAPQLQTLSLQYASQIQKLHDLKTAIATLESQLEQ